MNERQIIEHLQLIEAVLRGFSVGMARNDALNSVLTLLMEIPNVIAYMDFIKEIAKQKPEKPDYWCVCGQCSNNISDAEDLLEFFAKTESELDVGDGWAAKFKVGGYYNWKYQSERLIYLGASTRSYKRWHQFARVQLPNVAWCEVLDSELYMIEETTN